MDILEKLYGPRQKTRGNIEEGITSKISKLENTINKNKTDLQPTINKVNKMESTINTTIDNYLKDETNTKNLDIKFNIV